MPASDLPTKKSLTPQRKHRKLLKDGSGSEVWPEAIETIFVQGLRQYWDSPWAAYSQSRGRSRWRNQFLVDYLQKAGITRSKKQVASHIQVLRNMWKGEPEFHLVAGGDELALDPSLSPPPKLEDHCDTDLLIPIDSDDNDAMSSSTTSPEYSPPDYFSEFPPSPVHSMYSPDPVIYSESTHNSPSSLAYTVSLSNSDSMYPYPEQPCSVQPYPLNAYPIVSSGLPVSGKAGLPMPPALTTNMSPPSTHRYSSNRLTSFSLLADGMSPASIRIDALMPPTDPSGCPSPVMLKIKLCITSVDDLRSPSTLHGFVGNICLANVWMSSGKCITKVYAGSTCISQEVGALDVSHIDVGTVVASLPESSLSRCRWLDPTVQTTVTQEIITDNETLGYIIYNLDRSSGSGMPSAELLNYRRHVPQNKTASTPPSATSPYPLCTSSHPIPVRRSQTALSYAITPVNKIRQWSQPCISEVPQVSFTHLRSGVL